MMRLALALAFFGMAVYWSPASGQRQFDPCPLKIEITANGDFYTNRFQGRYNFKAAIRRASSF
jgi:hypothetical protein